MHMKKLHRLMGPLLAFGLFLTTVVPVQSGSLYSRHGIGLLRYRDGVKATALGGLSIPLADSVSIHFINPATLASVPLTHIHGEFIYDWAKVSLANNEGEFQDTGIGGLDLLFPLQRGFAIAMGLQPYSRADYIFEGGGSLTDTDYKETIQGTGGINTAYFAFAGTASGIRFGVAADFFFGVIEQNWRVNYTSSDYSATNDIRSTRLRGFGGHAGIQARWRRWDLGAAFGTSANLSSETSLRTSRSNGEVGDLQEGTVRLPLWYGGGFAFHPSRRFLIGSQVRMQLWGGVDSAELLGAQGTDSHLLSFGAEYVPSVNPRDGFFSKLNLRLGFMLSRLPYKDIAGNDVDEMIVATGIGVPFNRGFSRLDFAVEFGKRGRSDVNPAEETIFRFSASVNGSEKWFQRRGRR